MLTTAENMLNDALSTYTHDAENRIATRDVELSGGLAGADEAEGGGDRRLGIGAAGVRKASGHYALTCARLLQNRSLALFSPQCAFPTLMFDELDICSRFPAAFDGALQTARRSTKQHVLEEGRCRSETILSTSSRLWNRQMDRNIEGLKRSARTVTWAASTSRKRSSELPCFVICPHRRRSPLDYSNGTSPR